MTRFDPRQLQEYERRLKDKDQDINKLEKLIRQNENDYKRRVEDLNKQLNTKDLKIQQLQEQINTELNEANVDEVLQKEFTLEKINNQVLTKNLDQNIARLVELEGENRLIQYEVTELRDELKNIRESYIKEQELRFDLENELKTVNERTQNAFEAVDVSHYFTHAINDFNKNVNNENNMVDYIINGIDIELKAYMGRTEDNKMLMSSPSLGSNNEETLSQLKFSIQAVPKDMAADD